jgi:hypothetical protein
MTRGLLLIMYAAIAYFVKPQGLYSFITKAPILFSSTCSTQTKFIFVGIIIVSFGFWWSDDVDLNQNHSYFILAASLVEYLGLYSTHQCLILLGLLFGKSVLLEHIFRSMLEQSKSLSIIFHHHIRAYIPVNINHQSARTSSFILSVFGKTFFL